MLITQTMEYVAKEKSTALRNRDWARLREADIYAGKCNFTSEEKRWLATMIKNEMEGKVI